VKTLGSKENSPLGHCHAVSRIKRNFKKSHSHSVSHTTGIIEITALLIALEERVLCLSSLQQAAEEIRALRDCIEANHKDYPKCLELVPYYLLVKKLLRLRNSSRIRNGPTSALKKEERKEE